MQVESLMKRSLDEPMGDADGEATGGFLQQLRAHAAALVPCGLPTLRGWNERRPSADAMRYADAVAPPAASGELSVAAHAPVPLDPARRPCRLAAAIAGGAVRRGRFAFPCDPPPLRLAQRSRRKHRSVGNAKGRGRSVSPVVGIAQRPILTKTYILKF